MGHVKTLSGICCDQITVRSGGMAASEQLEAMGTYIFMKQDENGSDIYQHRLYSDRFLSRFGGFWGVSSILRTK